MTSNLARSLAVAGTINAVLGAGFVFLATAAPDALGATVDMVSTRGPVGPLSAAALFAFALVGAIMVGFGVLVVALARGAGVAQAVGVSLLTWFVVDSSASVATGFALNVVGNLAFLALFTPALRSLARRRTAQEAALG
ncbi:MAG: hypothetical protein H6745_01800 [Deltaproteobacteria bacterium]|nr:hypothetical protein [Deltaproteobacteria bacterium]